MTTQLESDVQTFVAMPRHNELNIFLYFVKGGGGGVYRVTIDVLENWRTRLPATAFTHVSTTVYAVLYPFRTDRTNVRLGETLRHSHRGGRDSGVERKGALGDADG